MKYFANAFIITEDTYSVRENMRYCEMKELKHYTSFECEEGTFILSRKCNNDYYGN